MTLPGGADGAPGRVVRLVDVCFKPFGEACATQSVLQYWRMDRGLYESERDRNATAPGRLTPEYCLEHW